MTVRECQLRMSSAEFSEWIAFNRVEEFGQLRQDKRFAQICQMLYQIFGDGPVMTIEDFMFVDKPDQTPEEMMAVMKRFEKKE